MSIDREIRQRVVPVYLDALQLVDASHAAARRDVANELEHYADVLPEPDAWCTTGVGHEAALLLLAGDTLFTVTREFEVPELVVECELVRVTRATYRRIEQETIWCFQFRDREPLEVRGFTPNPNSPDDPEQFDEAERLARALASRLGWTT